MLTSSRRLHHSSDFQYAVRHGRRVRRGVLVAHIASTEQSTRCGFIVSKAVGNSVVRHRVTRRLRHLAHTAYEAMPTRSLVVLRALPGAADAPFSELEADLRRVLAATSGS